jgi:hypothetical protein
MAYKVWRRRRRRRKSYRLLFCVGLAITDPNGRNSFRVFENGVLREFLDLKETQSTRKEEKSNWGGLLNFTLFLELLMALWPLSEPWPPSSPMSRHWALIFVTDLFLTLLPFVFSSIPRPSGEHSSSETFFQNLFRDSAVQGAVKRHLSGSPNIRLGLTLRVKFSRILQN